ncbi:MAG: hypothetical protein CMJ18_18510 [Phycisphaeraceae bacterium]|nr:hypothetical protein [Phycisphaeraceae bacterium]
MNAMTESVRDLPGNPRRVAWYRVPIDKQTMKALHRRSDLKGAVQLSGHLALIVALGTLAWWNRHQPALLVPLLFLYGTCFAFIMNATHELSHHTVFRTRFLNRFFLALYSFFGWRSYEVFRASHGEHHRYTLHQPDDLEVVLPSQITLRTFLATAFVDVLYLHIALRNTLALSVGRPAGVWNQHLLNMMEEPRRRGVIRWARFILIGHATIITVSFALGLWMIPLLTSFAIFFGQWLRFLCNNTQHAGLTDDVPDFRLCTRTVILGSVVRFLYWHMNYHIEHHMYPAVPCYNLGQLHAAIRHELPECPHGLIAAWRQIIGILRRQREDPKYQFLPKVPVPMPAGAA